MHDPITFKEGDSHTIIPDDMPNDETLAAFAEGDKMLETGTGLRFEGSTEDLFQSLLKKEKEINL